MPSDLRALLRDATPEPVCSADIDRVASKARSRTLRARLAALGCIAALIGAVSLAQTGGNGPADPDIAARTTTSNDSSSELNGLQMQNLVGFDGVVVLGAPVGYEETGSLVTIDLETGTAHQRTRDVRLWPGDFPHPLIVIDDRILWAANDHVRSLPLDLQGEPLDIGDASFLLPSATPGRVWFISQNPMRAAEADADGTTVQPERPLPEDAWPHAAVEGGLLISTGDALAVWDPSNGSTRRVYDDRAVLAAAGDRAYLGDGLQLELSTGDVTFLGIGAQTDEAAAFSPDGRHLAVFTRSQRTGTAALNVYANGQSEPRHYSITDIAALAPSGITWSPDSDAVFLLAKNFNDDGSADRLIGIPLNGSAQTMVSINRPGWYWTAAG